MFSLLRIGSKTGNWRKTFHMFYRKLAFPLSSKGSKGLLLFFFYSALTDLHTTTYKNKIKGK